MASTLREEWLSHGALPIIASVSGGKDSAAMALALMDADIPFQSVFMDTGWEWAGTYDYVRGPLASRIGVINEISGAQKMPELCIHKGMFPSRVRRFCTELLKVDPASKYIKSRASDVINAVGIRAEESARRAMQPAWEWSSTYECEVWRPILHWSEQDVIDIHARHGLAPNPLYIAGASRVGCWPCVFARKSELKMLAELDPGRVDEIRDLEATVGQIARHRRAGKGESMDGWIPPTFFQSREDNRRTVNGVRERGTGLFPCWPIDRVMEWARGPEGQTELFESDPWDRGCARWGLCDLRHGGQRT